MIHNGRIMLCKDLYQVRKRYQKQSLHEVDIYGRLFRFHKYKGKEFAHTLNPRWNSFDGKNAAVYVDGNSDLQPDFPLEEIWQLHLTSLSYQPWHLKIILTKANYKRKI